MRRVLGLALLAVLAVGLLPAAPVSVVGQSATITLSFDDGGTPAEAVTGVSEEDGAQTVRVVATASTATSAAVTVNVTIAAGTATVATDYATSVSSTTVTIANGATAGQSAGLTVTPVSDMSVEGDETIVFSATTSATGYAAISNVDLLIFDDDDDITLSFDDGAGTPSAVTGVSEEGGAQTVRVGHPGADGEFGAVGGGDDRGRHGRHDHGLYDFGDVRHGEHRRQCRIGYVGGATGYAGVGYDRGGR